MSAFNQRKEYSAKTGVRLASTFVIFIGCLALIGWILNIPSLKSVLPNLATMKVNTALGFVLSGTSLWLLHNEAMLPRYRRAAQICAAIVVMLGLITLIEYIFKIDLLIDQLFIKDTAPVKGVSVQGRMSHATAFCFLLIGTALFLLSQSRYYVVTQALALSVVALALLALDSYFYNITSLYSFFAFSTMALHTAFSFMVVSLGVLLARPQQGLMAVISANQLGGVMARRLLPWAVIIPLTVAWFRLKGQQTGYYNAEFGLALSVVTHITLFSILVWLTAYLLNRMDRSQQKISERVQKLNRILAVLSDINQTIVRIRELPVLFEIACQIAVEKGGMRIAWLGLIDPHTEQLNGVAQVGIPDGNMEKLVNAQVREWSNRSTEEYLIYMDADYGTAATFPLIQETQIRGFFTLYTDEPHFFDDEEIRLLIEMAGDIAFAMAFADRDTQRRQAETTAQRYAQRMEILHRIDIDIINASSIQEVVQSVLRQVLELIPCQRGSIFLANQEDGIIFAVNTSVSSQVETGTKIPLPPQWQEYYSAQGTRLVDDLRLEIAHNPLSQGLINEGMISVLNVLLKSHGQALGSFNLMADTVGFFTPEYQDIAVEVANQLAIAIYQIHLSEELASYTNELEKRVNERTLELNHAKERVEVILNNSIDGIVLVKTDLTIQQTNLAFDRIFASETDEYFGQSLLTLIPEADRDPIRQLVQTILVTQAGNSIEIHIQRQDGSLFDAELSIGVINEMDSLVCTIHDITERKKAEEILRNKLEEEQNIQAALKTLHEISIELMQIEKLDDFYRRVVELGLSRLGFERMGLMLYDESTGLMQGKYGTDIHGQVVSEHHISLDPTQLTGILSRSLHTSDRFVFEDEVMLYSNLEPVGVGWNATAVLWNTERNLGWLAVDNGVLHRPHSQLLLDILALYALTIGTLMERKQAEAITREQHNFLQLVIDQIPDLILVKGQDGYFQMVNKNMAEVFGLTPSEIVGKTDADINPHQEEVESYLQKDRETLESGQMVFIPEETILGRHYQTSKIPLQNKAGHYDRLLVVCSDITNRKVSEEALQQALEKEREVGELKSRFVSMASHEFRTPLATILAITDSLVAYRTRMTEEQINQRLDKIQIQIGHLEEIMDDVLLLARLQARRGEFTPAIFDLDDLARSVLDEFVSHPTHAHTITYSCADTLRKVRLDKRLIRQIISNLVSNAIKYSPQGEPITVSLEHLDGMLVLKVSDQGIGIPEADFKHLFEPFHRASNVGAIAGTGLGLVIIKEFVELHSGEITVESQLDVGTTFIVRIPLGALE